MDAQRTLAAIVFTDVVGYSALMAQDESRAMALFEQDLAIMREICARNDGQILKTMGDGTLMVFGSAVQAVSSALEMQAAFTPTDPGAEKRLVHRIGIHVGDVLLSESDAQGDGVNVAARLHEEAPPGGIWVSSTVYEIVKGRLPVTGISRGKREFKNIPVPVMVFEVSQGGRPIKSRPRRSNQKQVSTGAMIVLAAAIVSAGGLIYLGSLHPKEVDRYIENALPTTKPSNPAPIPATPSRVPSRPARSDNRVAKRETPTRVARSEQPQALPPAHKSVSTPTPKTKNVPASNSIVSQKVSAPPSQVPPIAAPPSGGRPPSPAPQTVADANDSESQISAAKIDPTQARTHYLFKRYMLFLQSLPDAETPDGKRTYGRWRGMSLLKDQVTAYLSSHTTDSAVSVPMDGPFGTGSYRVSATPVPGKPGQSRIQLQSADGNSVKLGFGQLTPSQLDAIFVAVGRAVYQDPTVASQQPVYRRRLRFFEDEYGLPKSTL